MSDSGSTTGELWSGSFGDDYVARNQGPELVSASLSMLRRALAGATDIGSVIEFGANTGRNLQALQQLFPGVRPTAVEINQGACVELKRADFETIHQSFIGLDMEREFDLVLTAGVLIHIDPRELPRAYQAIYNHAGRYILISEYYSPEPLEVPYRGLSGVMWRRDFAGEMLDAFADLTLLDCGFSYHRSHPGYGDTSWFLLERTSHTE